MTKQWTAKWPEIANAALRIVQNHGEYIYFPRFYGGIAPIAPLDPPLSWVYDQTFSFSHCISTLSIWCCIFFARWTRVLWGKGVTRLNSARGKKQVWRPHVRNRSFGSKYTILKKVLVTLLGLFGAPRTHSVAPQWFGAPTVTRRPGNCAPLARRRYAPVMATPCDIGFYWKDGGPRPIVPQGP